MSATAVTTTDLLARASVAFARAAQREPVVERTIAPAGVPVRVRIAGRVLAERLLPALAAGDPDAGDAVLTIEAWDGASGVALPPSPWDADDVLPGEEVRGATSGDLLAAMAPDHGTVSLLDRATGRGCFWARDARVIPDWEDGAPLRHLLRWGLAGHGLALLHAAAVGVPGGRGALVLGNGGAGKSTTALACLEHGLDVVADDYCLVGGGHAHRLYAIGKIGARSLALLPGLAPLAGPLRGPHRKAHVPLGDRYARRVRVDALVFPRVADRPGPPVPLAPGPAVRRIVASTLAQMPGDREATVAALFGLARALPAYELPVGPDMGQVATAVRSLLEAA